MIPKKWTLAAGAVLIAGALTAGVALAASDATSVPAPPIPTARWEKGEKPSPELAELMQQLRAVRRKYMEQAQTESRALIEQAVKDGRITQEQADRLLHHKRMGHPRHGRPGFHKGRKPVTEEQVRARLQRAVASGRLSQAQADEILKRWQERHSEGQ